MISRRSRAAARHQGTPLSSSAYARWGKRALDLILAIPATAVLAPVIGLAAVCVKLESKGPAFFEQVRIGRNESPFTVYKLRTMTFDNRAAGQVLEGHPDVTTVGAVLRRSKLDELPQLYNVIIGEMSLVGPRPCLPTTATEVDDNGRYRFLVRPGLTGRAQTRGNIALSWPERWALDREYVEDFSFWQDFLIIAKTVAVVILGESRWVQQ